MQKIVPHLWFDTQAKEATALYASVFPNSKVESVTVLKDTPSGDCDTVVFNIMGQDFMAISAGPYFKLNPSISFMVNFDPSQDEKAAERIDAVWNTLADGGVVRMELGEYPFSKKYGWVDDKYGVSWQLILTDPQGEERPQIIPSLLFVKENCGKASEAIDFYTSVFKNSKKGQQVQYGPGREPDKEGTLMFGEFMIEGTWFTCMDSAHQHDFNFNEAVSFMVKCDTQEELDYYTNKLSAVLEAEQCGWVKDKYGVSWQISPTALDAMMVSSDAEAVSRVTQAFLQMKRFDISKLEEAFKG